MYPAQVWTPTLPHMHRFNKKVVTYDLGLHSGPDLIWKKKIKICFVHTFINKSDVSHLESKKIRFGSFQLSCDHSLSLVIKQDTMGPVTPAVSFVKNDLDGDSRHGIQQQMTCWSRWTLHCLCLVVFSFPEEMEGDSEEPESYLSWLRTPRRKPRVTGCLTTALPTVATHPPTVV